MSGPTPGPWFAKYSADGSGDIGIVAVAPSVAAGAVVLAEVFSEITHKGERSEHTLPNALVIAASAELLIELQHVVRWFDQLRPSDIERYRAVIAKATQPP